MISYIITILCIASTTKAVYPCDGIEYVMSGIKVHLAAGVCQADSDGGSGMLRCEDANTLNSVSYGTIDCTGTPRGTAPMAATMAQIGVTDYTIICCTAQCDYEHEREYNTSTCVESTTNAPFHDAAGTIGVCMGMIDTIMYTFSSCTLGAVSMKAWSGAANCSDIGAEMNYPGTYDGMCDNATRNQYEVTCGTAINTCPGAQTQQPTTETFSPTSITGIPTTTPTSVTTMPSISPTGNSGSPTSSTGSPSAQPSLNSVSPSSSPEMAPTSDTTAPSVMPTGPVNIVASNIGSAVAFDVLIGLWIAIAIMLFV